MNSIPRYYKVYLLHSAKARWPGLIQLPAENLPNKTRLKLLTIHELNFLNVRVVPSTFSDEFNRRIVSRKK